MRRALLIGFLAAGSLGAQFVEVYSEFRRIAPSGEIVSPDRGGYPREILSPLLARNSHSTYHLVIDAPPEKYFYLFVGTNPEDIFEITVYQELWRKVGDEWIPDGLRKVETPYLGRIPSGSTTIPDQRVAVFLVDLYVPADLAPGRYKFEPQVSIDDGWVVYPMEVRVSDVVVPDRPRSDRRLPDVGDSSDAMVLGPLRDHWCGIKENSSPGGPVTVRRLIHRNILEDLSLIRHEEENHGRETFAAQVLSPLEIDIPTFCAAEDLKHPSGPEWFLRVRDHLYRGTREWY